MSPDAIRLLAALYVVAGIAILCGVLGLSMTPVRERSDRVVSWVLILDGAAMVAVVTRVLF